MSQVIRRTPSPSRSGLMVSVSFGTAAVSFAAGSGFGPDSEVGAKQLMQDRLAVLYQNGPQRQSSLRMKEIRKDYNRSHKWWLNLVNYFLRVRERAKGGQARTMGTRRCPVANDRTDLGPQRRSDVEPVPGRIRERCSTAFCGVGHRSAVARPRQEIPAVPDLPSSVPTVGTGGKLEHILGALAEELQARGKLDPEEAFIDASFTGAKRGPRSRAHQTRQGDENHRSRR